MRLSASRTAAHRDVQRASVLLMAGQGLATTRIAAQAGLSPATVAAWRERFAVAYLNANNQDPKPFIWTATADQILAKVRRGRITLAAITN